ncbi:MAG: exodeoxyribonuclease III [Formosimonas sp.]
MRVITANLNGIRAASRKGFFDWLAGQNADFVCVQELKAQDADLDELMRAPAGLSGYFHCAQKKGYSGVGLYARTTPDEVIFGFDNGGEFDNEGRCVEARYGARSVISVYFTSGSNDEPAKQASKFRFLAAFMTHIAALKAAGRELIICGDVNIAHHEIDLKNWKGNLKNSGFLPEERAWLTQFLADNDLIDVYRHLHPETEQYTWWSNRGQARANNVGWRIDYQLASSHLAATACSTSVYRDVMFSDHAPLIVDYDL